MPMAMAIGDCVSVAVTLVRLGTESEGTEVETASTAKSSNRAASRYRLEGAMKTTATDGEIAKVTGRCSVYTKGICRAN